MPEEIKPAKPQSWEQVYTILEPPQLPWNAGAPDADLVRLVEAGRVPPGRAVDLGCGLGHDAIFLARRGFSVTAVDIAAAAISMARANANLAEVGDKIEFLPLDALKLALEPASVSFFNDRGLFHFLAPAEREAYREIILRALAPGGLLLLRTFSDQEPPGPGPRRFSRKELEDFFSASFNIVEAKDGVFEGPQKPKPKALLYLLQKKP